jgi:hypothetical protein
MIFPRLTNGTKHSYNNHPSLGRVGLAQLISFLVVELIHPSSNLRFNMSVIFTFNYSLSERRRLHRQRCDLSDRLRES